MWRWSRGQDNTSGINFLEIWGNFLWKAHTDTDTQTRSVNLLKEFIEHLRKKAQGSQGIRQFLQG